MFNYWTSNCTNLPLERLNKTSNKSLYIKRFKEMAWKYFCVINNRLYYIKSLKYKRNDDGSIEENDENNIKKIPYIYEIYPYFKKLHDKNFHASKDSLIKLKEKLDIYLDSYEFIIEKIMNECPICYAKYFSIKLKNKISIIQDYGPHYRYLMDITYLKNDIYNGKTTYKYIIDFIDHFSKFYWGFLIRDKKSATVLKYIKLFVQINKKPKIFQCDNGKEFINSLIIDYMNEEHIKFVQSRPHHPQTNGTLSFRGP